MHFSIPSTHLKRATALMRPLICAKSTLPILSHALIERTEAGTVVFSATDLDQHVRIPCVVTDDKAGAFTAPFVLLRRVAQEADKDTPIRFDLVEGNVELQWVSKGKPWRETSDTLPAVEFPVPPDTTGWTGQWFPSALAELLGPAAAMASTDEMRYVLNGVYLDATNHHVVSTDGRRLMAALSPVSLGASVIIPSKAATYLAQHMGEDGPAWFKIEDKQGRHGLAQLPGGVFYSFRCVDGNFPNWTQVVPNDQGMKCRAQFTLEDEEIEDLFRKQAARNMDRVDLKLEHGRLMLRFITVKDDASGWHVVGMENGGGEARMIRFNLHFLWPMLRHVGKTFRYIDDICPAVFEGPNRVGVLMPMRGAEPVAKSKAASEKGKAKSEKGEKKEEEEEAEVAAK